MNAPKGSRCEPGPLVPDRSNRALATDGHRSTRMKFVLIRVHLCSSVADHSCPSAPGSRGGRAAPERWPHAVGLREETLHRRAKHQRVSTNGRRVPGSAIDRAFPLLAGSPAGVRKSDGSMNRRWALGSSAIVLASNSVFLHREGGPERRYPTSRLAVPDGELPCAPVHFRVQTLMLC